MTKTNTNAKQQPKAINYNILDTFGKEHVAAPEGAEIAGYESPGSYTPGAESDYEFRKDLMTDIMAWWQIGDGEPLFLAGPSGSGKSSVVRQICARLNYGLQHTVGHNRLEFPELASTMVIRGGNTVLVPGPLARAMKCGMVFLFDEIDLVDESTNAALNEVLQGRPLLVPETGELIEPHPMFRFIATGNSQGGRDHTGLYSGIVNQNMAFMERFIHLRVDYPDPDMELRILSKSAPASPKEILEKMIEVAGEVRRAFMGESQDGAACEVTFSTRTLRRWAKFATYYAPWASVGQQPFEMALEKVLLNRATPETASFIRGLVQRIIGG